MARKTTERSNPLQDYWGTRLRSSSFRRTLKDLIARELRELAGAKLRDVVDPGAVRKTIAGLKIDLVAPEVVAEVILLGNRRLGERLQRHGASILGALDPAIAADIESLLDEDVDLSGQVENFAGQIMRQEFILRLFTDILFTSIASFYQKVNPLFGALTVRMLEDQIKGFIRLFLPMVQRQVTAFALDPGNRRLLLELARAVVRQVLDEPLRSYATMVSSRQRKKAESLLRKAVAHPDLETVIRDLALRMWNDFYEMTSAKSVGAILRIGDHADWLAEQVAAFLLPALERPEAIRFVAGELALSPSQVPAAGAAREGKDVDRRPGRQGKR